MDKFDDNFKFNITKDEIKDRLFKFNLTKIRESVYEYMLSHVLLKPCRALRVRALIRFHRRHVAATGSPEP